jgi:hypothetical protein
MKRAFSCLLFLGWLGFSVVYANETPSWWSPDHQHQAFAVLRHEPDRPDRDDLVWDAVTVKDAKGFTLASLSLKVGSGVNRAVVSTAAWSSDARFFVFATTSSGGHSVWHMPSYVYNASTSRIYSIDDTIGNTTDDNPEFEISKSDILKIRFWDGATADEEASPRMIDLRDFVKKGAKIALNSHCYAPHHR